VIRRTRVSRQTGVECADLMEHAHPEAILWREGNQRCELWATDVGPELRVWQAAKLLA